MVKTGLGTLRENNTDRICLFKHDGTSFKANGLADYDTIFDWEGWGDATEAQMKEGWHNSVEFRYPEDFGLTDKDGKVWTEDEHKASLIEKFKRFYTFVASTDTAAATNAALEESVTYGETTYTIDSAEYRKAKFINEFEDYMVKDIVANLENEFTCKSQAKEYKEARYLASKDTITSKIQMIFQDPIASLNPRMTVREIIAEGLIIRALSYDYIKRPVNKTEFNTRINALIKT